jgi:hypothetical protein
MNSEENTQEVIETAADSVPERVVAQVAQDNSWLPEKFKTPEDLLSSYNALESKLGSSREDIEAEIMSGLESEAYADRPESIGDYQIPEVLDVEAVADNELLNWWAEHSFESGFSQEQFEEGIKIYAEAQSGSMPDMDAEYNRLGDNAEARIESASLFANKFFPEDAMPAIERMCETADGIFALEAMMQAVRDDTGGGNTQSAGRVNEDTLKQMMLDPRYHDPARREKEFVRQVDEGWKTLFR